MSDRIYVENADGQLEPTDETPFAQEGDLQEFLAAHPELLAGEQMGGDEPRRWILIKREQGVPEREEGGDRWSLDHLFVDQDAVPTLVECKRPSSGDLRRKIVAQMMDYAAHSKFWNVDEIRDAFEANLTEDESDAMFANLLAVAANDVDRDQFWSRLHANLAARRLRLLFVADEIPDSLRNIVEFLHEQMPNIDVFAVEVKRYVGEGTVATYVPKVTGRINSAASQRPKGTAMLSQEDLLNRVPEGAPRDALRNLMISAEEAGATLSCRTKSITVSVESPMWRNWLSIAWLNPPSAPLDGRGKGSGQNASFGSQNEDAHGQALRDLLDPWTKYFEKLENSTPQAYNWARMSSLTYEQLADCVEDVIPLMVELIHNLKAQPPG